MGLSIDPKHIKRYGQIAALLIRHGRADLVQQAKLGASIEAAALETAAGPESDSDTTKRAESLAEDLERLGPTYIKLGQLLSSRVDLLPPPYLRALARLQDRVEPFPFGEVERIVSGELGVRLSKAFREFDREPLAAASLSQVHRATLRDGRVVAVKVQRPDIRDLIRDDLDALAELAEFLDEHSSRAHRYQLVDVLDEFRRSLIRELDFRNEARNLETLAKNLAEFHGIVVPTPVDDYTTSRIITMDLIRGRKVTAISPLALMEMDREAMADELFRAYLKQILVDGFFHSDPHPGNVFITDGGGLALIDLGQVGTVSPDMRESLMKLMMAVADGDSSEVASILIRLSETESGADTGAFRDAVTEVVLLAEGRSASEIALGAVLLGLVQTAVEHKIRPAVELVMIGKTLLNLDEVGRALDPSLEPNQMIRNHATELMERKVLSSLRPANLFKAALEANELVQRMPQRLNRIMGLVADNELSIRVNAIDEARLLRGLDKIANRITLGLLIAALILGASLLMRVEAGPTLLGYPALALIFFVIAAVAGIALSVKIALRDPDEHD
jgi:ubiquinone biosynthesis protein